MAGKLRGGGTPALPAALLSAPWKLRGARCGERADPGEWVGESPTLNLLWSARSVAAGQAWLLEAARGLTGTLPAG